MLILLSITCHCTPFQLGSPPTAAGHALCRSAWLRFLGIGKQRIHRTKRKFRGLDGRTINQGISSESMFWRIDSRIVSFHMTPMLRIDSSSCFANSILHGILSTYVLDSSRVYGNQALWLFEHGVDFEFQILGDVSQTYLDYMISIFVGPLQVRICWNCSTVQIGWRTSWAAVTKTCRSRTLGGDHPDTAGI